MGALAVMLPACYKHAGMNLQVKNVPRELHERLRRHAHKRNRTMSDVVLAAVEHELARSEWRERFSRRPAADLDIGAASLLEEARRERGRQSE